MVSLSREGRKLCGPTLSPLSSLSTSDSRLSVSPQRNDQDRDNPTKPLNTPSEDYSCVKSVREWYHYIQHNTQFYDNHSFAPMEFINEYFAFENLTQIGNWSESWPILRQTPTKVCHFRPIGSCFNTSSRRQMLLITQPQIKSMLKDKNISLTLSFIFMQKLTGCFDLAADFRHRVAKVLKLILDFASDMYGHKHPLPLLLDEIFSQEGFPDESTDAHIFRIVFDSIRCSHHRAELRLVIATNLMWGDHLQSAETAFKGLVSAHTMPEENHIETIGGKVDMFIGSLARQNLAVVWMRQGKLEQSEELLREVLDRTKEFPLLHLSATSRLAKALYARRMHVQAESMLKDALTVARRLPKESQRVSFQADFESQLQNVRASHLSVTQDATIWHYYLSGIQSSRYEDSMCKWGSDQVCQDVAGI